MTIHGKRAFFYLNLLTALLLCFPFSFLQAQTKTIIHGLIKDELTGDPLPFVSVVFKGTAIGTISDAQGKYRLETSSKASVLAFSFLGYQTETRIIQPGKEQIVSVIMKLSSINLDEVIVSYERKSYRNKGNPAVRLIQKVISNKEKNRSESFDFLEYKKYEKIEFAVSNISDKLKESSLFHKFRFIFDNLDTTRRIGNAVLPVYIKETMSDCYFRKEPEAKKENVLGEKTVDLERYLSNKGVTNYLNYLYQNINIYDNEIFFLSNKFLSPVAGTAPAFYKYYIQDTLIINDIPCVRMFFAPRNKTDILFHGYLYITMDSSYAIRKIDMGINKDINIDWVQELSIVQDFEKSSNNKWMLSKDEISIDFGIVKNMTGIYGQRTIFYEDYKFNEPISEEVFNPSQTTDRDTASLSPGYWERIRPSALTRTEKATYTTIDSLNSMPEFRRRMDFITMIASSWLNAGRLEIGPVSGFYSYNDIEGSRFRFGGRTSTSFSRKLTLDGYLAYGLRDHAFKYAGGFTWSFTPRTIYEFPVHSLKISYQKDLRTPGQELEFHEPDNVLLSFQRGVHDKFFLNNNFKINYLHEYNNHFSFETGYSFNRQYSYGNLAYFSSDSSGTQPVTDKINISEVFLNLRYAPDEKFYQGKQYRTRFPGKKPVLELRLAAGSDLTGNDYNYLRAQFSVSRRYYLSIIGYTDVTVEAGKVFGKVPYPLLFLHRANQTYEYQQYSYNLMNFLEFVSDEYGSLNIDHSFNGFILNKIPLVKKLKWREVVTFKALYGRVENKNNPEITGGLFRFPEDAEGVPLTYTLQKSPYIEAGFGFSNIARIFRVDLIRRFTYTGNPNVTTTGLRVQFRLDI